MRAKNQNRIRPISPSLQCLSKDVAICFSFYFCQKDRVPPKNCFLLDAEKNTLKKGNNILLPLLSLPQA
jgi:hypothetical protein